MDGGSTDGTVAQAMSLGFSKVLKHPDANIPLCRNKGLEATSGQWIAFLDGDCEPSVDWILKALPYLEQPTPTLIGWPVEPPSPGTWVQRYWFIHWANKRRGGQNDAFRLITTRNMLFHRIIADHLHGFDETLTTGEDTDFVLRATQAGFLVQAIPELRVIHYGEPATLRQFFRQQIWHANRTSYTKIVQATGLQTGGHAVLFSTLFLGNLFLCIVAVALLLTFKCFYFMALFLPLIALVAIPAGLMSLRAHTPRAFFPLGILYAAYGLARSLDLAGFARNKRPWKKGS